METVTESLLPDPNGIERASALLRAGELVAFPTETVYALRQALPPAESAPSVLP